MINLFVNTTVFFVFRMWTPYSVCGTETLSTEHLVGPANFNLISYSSAICFILLMYVFIQLGVGDVSVSFHLPQTNKKNKMLVNVKVSKESVRHKSSSPSVTLSWSSQKQQQCHLKAVSCHRV